VVEAESPLPLVGGGRRAGGDAPGASTDQTTPRPAAPPSQGGRESAPEAGNIVDVPAPLLGVFYRAPKPGAPPFVEVGQRVEPDTVIAIIEVMKLMNSVRAGVSGEVVEVVAQNAAMVEHGEALIRVRTKQ